MESLPADTKEWFAQTRWSIDDIKELKPEWNDEKCRDFLEKYANKIVNSMVEAGWFAIENFLENEAKE